MKIDSTKPYIVGIGGANIDLHGKLFCEAVLHDSNPGRVKTSAGGVTRNILDNLSRMGQKTILLTALGDDLNGKAVITASKAVGIDMSKVLISSDYPTGSYLALLDKEGDLLISSADTQIIENIPLSYFEENSGVIQNAEAIVCDPNLEVKQLGKIAELAGDTKIYIDPTSGSKAKKIKEILNIFYFIKPNLLELEVLSDTRILNDDDIIKATDKLIEKGTSCVAVSLGRRGCYYADKTGKAMFRSLNYEADVVDETGAGDAFMAGMIVAKMQGLGIEKCLDYALCAGAIATLSDNTINPNMSIDLIKEFVNKYSKE